MNQPLVSVFMPAYNQVEFVAEALQSAVDQDYPNLEVVAGDDGSVDGTDDIIRDYARRYPDRVKPIVGEPHVGLTPNCNRTFKTCTGKYIACFAGDDMYLPGKITRQVEWLEADERRVMCGHDVEAFDSDTGRRLSLDSDHGPLRAGRGAEAIVRYGPAYSGVSIMVRASAIPSSGFDERLPIVSDWKFQIDYLAAGGEYGFIEGVYARYRRHVRSVSLDLMRPQYLEDKFKLLDLVEATYPHLARACRHARARLLYVVGSERLLRGDRTAARQYLGRTVTQDLWLSWKVPIKLALACLPEALTRRLLKDR